MLAKKPSQRFQSAVELEMFFEGFVSHLNMPTQHRLPKVPRTAAWKIKAVSLSLLSVGTLIVTIFGIAHLMKPAEPTAEALWQDIQIKNQLQAPAEFLEEIKELGDDFARIDRSIREFDRQEKPVFNNEVSRINSIIQLLESDFAELPDSESE